MKRLCQVGIITILLFLVLAGLNIADRSIASLTLEPRDGILVVSLKDDGMAVSLLGEEHQMPIPVAAWIERTSLVIQGIKAWVQQ